MCDALLPWMESIFQLRLVWPSIMLLFIERWRHLADGNEPNFITKYFFKFNWVTGSPPKFDTLLASCYPTYMQSFIISHSSFAEQYGDLAATDVKHRMTEVTGVQQQTLYVDTAT